MNIIRMRQEKREKLINQITASIKKSENKNFKEIVLASMANLNISRRTAREYVEVAFFKLGMNVK